MMTIRMITSAINTGTHGKELFFFFPPLGVGAGVGVVGVVREGVVLWEEDEGVVGAAVLVSLADVVAGGAVLFEAAG